MPSHLPNRLFELDILLCPACLCGNLRLQENHLSCEACDRAYTIDDGIPLLLRDPDAMTRLDHDSYDAQHEISDDNVDAIQRMWQTVFSEHAIRAGDVLEIGCGTGQLTRALPGIPGVKHVHATDISPAFLALTRQQLQSFSGKIFYYACDANHLPFQPSSFDLVVGHSVLHHLLDYSQVVEQAYGLLRPGGVAVFFEPVLQGKVMIAFLADLMLRIHEKTGYGNLDESDCDKIRTMIRHITKHKEFGDDREKLSTMEDKYIFDRHEFREMALKRGFIAAEYRNNPLHDEFRNFNVSQHLRMAGIAEAKIIEFRFLLRAAKKMLADLLPHDLITPMGFFILKK
ncbi:MAG TPA: methyltransferase domain-containing protein [Pseudomonadales bacterium]|nr:methyltransferase domain-containing protein [Pseudomonadales bacterium]